MTMKFHFHWLTSLFTFAQERHSHLNVLIMKKKSVISLHVTLQGQFKLRFNYIVMSLINDQKISSPT